MAGVAAEHGLPFLVISAGTRNHFALDLGLDREDPSACLAALSDGVELRVDLGLINGQTFVNNASFGAYAEVVETPAYRADKMGTTLDMLPDLLQGHGGARLTARVNGTQIETPQALLVANNPYGTGDLAGLGRRARLDRGVLGVVGVNVSTARQAVDLLRGRRATGLTVLTAKTIEVTADVPRIPVGIDGESVLLSTPVTCAVSPGALRVWVSRDRPGIPRPKSPVNWTRLRHLAGQGPVAGSPHPGTAIVGGGDMAKKKHAHNRHGAQAEVPSADAGREAADGPPPKMKRKEYEREMRALHGELVAMQEWVKASEPRSASCSRAGTPPGRAARSSGSPNGSARGCSGWWRCPPRPSARSRRCTSSGTSRTSRPPARS